MKMGMKNINMEIVAEIEFELVDMISNINQRYSGSLAQDTGRVVNVDVWSNQKWNDKRRRNWRNAVHTEMFDWRSADEEY